MEKNLKIAIEAAVKAGEEILRIYENEDFQVETKYDNSPLTIADKAANDIINEYLISTEIPIISEENKQTDYEIRKNWKECWIVDPLDGTKEFIKQNGEFTVNIAFIKNQQPIFGVIYVPVTKELYFGDVESSVSKKIKITSEFNIEDVLKNSVEIKPGTDKKIRVVGSRSHMNEDTLEYIENLKSDYKKEVEIVSKGSSLKFCIVAEGLADVYPRFAPNIVKTLFNTVSGKKIAVLGWAFKKDTNDTREAAAIYVTDYLLNEQAEVVVYDPKVTEEQIYADLDYLGTRSEEENRKLVKVIKTPLEACKDSHAVAVLTEWDEFKDLDWKKIYENMLKPAFLFDGRRLLNRKAKEELGFEFYAIGS